MKNAQDFRRMLEGIDHRSYGSYKKLAGSYQWKDYTLNVDHVQGDPFASPSRLSIEVPAARHHFPEEYYDRYHRKIALEDQVLRRFHRVFRKLDPSRSGSGKSGRISSAFPEQGVLPRMAVEFSKERLLFRFEMGFPARGRTILAREMGELVFKVLPELALSTFCYERWDEKSAGRLRTAIDLSDDQEAIRNYLREKKLLSFVADGSVLPRESGVSDRPMRGAVAFSSPESMRVSLDLPHAGRMTGMGIPEGITVITGGGYHGKSTLLKALEKGVYNHVSGDGREYVITREDAVKIRAEDGRSVKNTDISLFINNLPNGEDTRTFTSENASGSTSQAANVIEAFEAGSGLLLMDEDTSATNFMIRDRIMASLVPDEKEPISTLLNSIRKLYEEKNVSFVIVVGSSGDYLAVADHVLMMDHYRVLDVTKAARGICDRENVNLQTGQGPLPSIRLSKKLSPVRDGRMKLKASGTDSVIIDRETIDVRYLEQIAENGQTIGLAYLTAWILHRSKGGENLFLTIERLYEIIRNEGLAAVIPQGYPCGQPVLPRKEEVYACICRYRKAVLKQE